MGEVLFNGPNSPTIIAMERERHLQRMRELGVHKENPRRADSQESSDFVIQDEDAPEEEEDVEEAAEEEEVQDLPEEEDMEQEEAEEHVHQAVLAQAQNEKERD